VRDWLDWAVVWVLLVLAVALLLASVLW